jgi:hypothetical protein
MVPVLEHVATDLTTRGKVVQCPARLPAQLRGLVLVMYSAGRCPVARRLSMATFVASAVDRS